MLKIPGGLLSKEFGISSAFKYCAYADAIVLALFITYQLLSKRYEVLPPEAGRRGDVKRGFKVLTKANKSSKKWLGLV
jgi:hypothetical protein